MRGVLENRVTLESAAAFFQNDRAISNPDLREWIDYLIWEIGGAPDYWQKLLELFEAKASEETLIRWYEGLKCTNSCIDPAPLERARSRRCLSGRWNSPRILTTVIMIELAGMIRAERFDESTHGTHAILWRQGRTWTTHVGLDPSGIYQHARNASRR